MQCVAWELVPPILGFRIWCDGTDQSYGVVGMGAGSTDFASRAGIPP